MKDGFHWRLALLVVASLTLTTSDAGAYVRTLSKGGVPTAWKKMPITYVIDVNGMGNYFRLNPSFGKEGSEFLAVHRAFQTWQKARCDGQPVGLLFHFGGLSKAPWGFDPKCLPCNANLIAFFTDSASWEGSSSNMVEWSPRSPPTTKPERSSM